MGLRTYNDYRLKRMGQELYSSCPKFYQKNIFKVDNRQLDKKINSISFDKFLASKVIMFQNVWIEEAAYNKAVHLNKILYTEAPLVFGKTYSTEFQVFMVVIRPYLGKRDNKFFITHPDVREGKTTSLFFKEIKDFLKYNKNKE
ncbi:hypothetical protein NSS69_11900 [Macrococcus sp. FSL W8-0367]